MIRSKITLFNNKLTSKCAALLRSVKHEVIIEGQPVAVYGPCILPSGLAPKDNVFHPIDLKNLNFTTRYLLDKALYENSSDIKFLRNDREEPVHLNSASGGATIMFKNCALLGLDAHEKLSSLVEEALRKAESFVEGNMKKRG